MRNSSAWHRLVAIATVAVVAGCSAQVDPFGHRAPRAGEAATQGGTRAAPDAPADAPTLRLGTTHADGQPATLQLTAATLRQAIEHGVLVIRQADGSSYPVRMVRGQEEPGGRWSAIGKVVTRIGPQSMVLTFNGREVFGVLPQPDGSLLSITTTRGITSIAPAGGMVPNGESGATDFVAPPVPAKTGAHFISTAAAAVAGRANADPSLVQVDLLGLYTDELVAFRGTVSAAETEVIHQVAVSNQAHEDSGSRVRFALAGMRQVTVDAGAFNDAVLYSATDNGIAGVDIVRLRDELAADLVFVLRPHEEEDGTCGIAWLNGGGLAATDVSEHYGISVNNVGPACGPYVVPHELGHNLGSAHDIATSTSLDGISYGAFPWSFGYRQPGPPGFATVMAYEWQGMPWVGFFSSPGLGACMGVACGVADQADNVRSLDLMAPAIAAFRGPPGTLAIADGEVLESLPGESRQMSLPIRLSGPAPEGGVTFRVVVEGGSADEGEDYTLAFAPDRIEAGQREARVYFDVHGDDAVEGDEIFTVHLLDVAGAGVERADATITILDDDPRPVLRGRVRFAPGAPVPTEPFQVGVKDGPVPQVLQHVTVSPPDFAYAIPVSRSTNVTLTVSAPAPWVAPPLNVGWIAGDAEHDFPLMQGLTVSGRLRVPEGSPLPAFPLDLKVTESLALQDDGGLQEVRHLQLDGPDDSFSFTIVPGGWITMRTDPGAPYAPYLMIDAHVEADLVADVVLSGLPSLAIWGNDPIREGDGGTSCSCSYGVSLSAPAPEGGVTFSYRTVDGTATAGEDYVAASGIVTIPAGEDFADIRIDILYDDAREQDEYWDLLIEDVQGAVATASVVRYYMLDDDTRTGGPGQKQPSP